MKMSDLDLQLQEVHAAMAEPMSPNTAVEMKLSFLLHDLDDIVTLAASPATVEHIAANEKLVGQMLTRIQLIASMLEARKTPRFKVVR